MRKVLAVVSFVLMAGVSLPVMAQSEQGTKKNKDDVVLDEIVVTAQKRTENLIDVPISITAISGDKLTASARNNVRDLQYAVPNLTTYSQSDFSPNIIIRGFESSARNVGFESSLGVYVDGVFSGRTQSFTQELEDVERLEVLRGPQGTLFGKNTTTGAISITTRRPGNEYEGSAKIEYGSYDSFRANYSLSGPIITDKIAAKASGFYSRTDGTIRNVSGIGPRDIQGYETYGGRGEIRLTPSENLDIALRGDYSHRTARSYNNEIAAIIDNPAGIPIGSVAPGPRTITDSGAVEDRDLYGISLTANYTLGNDGVFTSISAYRKMNYDLNGNADFSPLDLLGLSNTDRLSQFSQEIRYASPDDKPFKYVIGAYYFSQRAKSSRSFLLGSDYVAFGAAGFEVPEEFFDPREVTSKPDIKTTSLAAFLNASYDITEKLSINVGARYSSEKKQLTVSQVTPFIFDVQDIYINVPATNGRLKDNDFSPTVGVAYKISDRVNAYVRYSKGFKSGGWNPELLAGSVATRNLAGDIIGYDISRVQFKPESITNYEIGIKSELFDRKVRFNLAVFQQDYKDIQISQFIGGLQGFATTNAGSARSQGFELELATKPVRGLDLSFGAGYSDAKYVSYLNADSSGTNLSGRRLDTPKWTLAVSGQYEQPIGGALSAVLGGDYSYRSGRPGDPLDPNSRTSGFGIFDARLGIQSDAGWSVFAFGKNLSRKDYITSRYTDTTFSIFGLSQQVESYGDPRTYGVRASLKF